MARRVKLILDKLPHINDITFEIFRSTEPIVDEEDTFVADVFDPVAVKEVYDIVDEELKKDSSTPYAFHVQRRYEMNPLPTLKLGGEDVPADSIHFFPEQKLLEIHGMDIGLSDSRKVYMSYQYQGTPVTDDYVPQNGINYHGPPATGLRPPKDIVFTHDEETQRLKIEFVPDLEPVQYYYRVRAKDSDGNYSPYSQELSIGMIPNTNEMYFRIQRSKEGNVWEDVNLITINEWYDDLYLVERPNNVTNASVTSINLQEAMVTFDNPWHYWNTYPRKVYQYRFRTEDFEGEVGEWIYITPPDIYLKPKEILIRRKVNNDSVSTKNGSDAIDVFRLTEDDVDINSPVIELIDNQLSEGYVYAWTFFYTDEIDMEAQPFYLTADHTGGDEEDAEPSTPDME